MTLKEKSIVVGNNKTQLKKRLMEEKYCLNDSIKPKFKNAKFDFRAKQLVGDGYILQWRVRRHPELPESYENQQTSVGTVVLIQNWQQLKILKSKGENYGTKKERMIY